MIQTFVKQIFGDLKRLSKLKQKGYNVDQLKLKPPGEFHSFMYSQSGFKLDKKDNQTVLSLSKFADITIRLRRAILDDTKLNQVTVKKETMGNSFIAMFGVEIVEFTDLNRKANSMLSSASAGCL